MTNATTYNRSEIFTKAWATFRAMTRWTFAQALSHAWKMAKKQVEAARKQAQIQRWEDEAQQQRDARAEARKAHPELGHLCNQLFDIKYHAIQSGTDCYVA